MSIRCISLATFVALGIVASPAFGQATRTWVSGVGDDANPCSRTAPCKTFAGAISRTAAGGEINCLDSGGFGAVTITKAITINCEGVIGGVLVSGTNAIVVNAGANDVVHLRGLDINGVGTGINAIRFIAGASLHVENTLIRGFNGGAANGIAFQPSGRSELYVNNVTIIRTGAASVGAAVLVQPTGTGSALAALRNVRIENNQNVGLSINTTGNTGSASLVMVDDTEIDGNEQGVNVTVPAGAAGVELMLARTTIARNNATGIVASGASALVRVGDSTIFGNFPGVSALSSASILSYGNNRLDGNRGNDGAFTGNVAPR